MNAFMIGGIIGFAPALFLIWFSLRKYSYPYVEGSLFEDRKVFFMLAVGMVAGTFISVLEFLLYPLFLFEGGIDLIMFVLIFVLAFPLIEDMAKYIILNYKSYEGRFDSMFYGIALGAGYSATAIIGQIVFESANLEGTGVSVLNWVAPFFLSACMAMIHCSIGATLGMATSKKMGMRAIPIAIMPHIVFNLMMFPWFVSGQIWYSLVVAIPISAFIFWGVHTKTVPESLPQEVQKEIRRNERKKLD